MDTDTVVKPDPKPGNKPKSVPANLIATKHRPEPEKTPVRFAIGPVTDKISDLREHIKNFDIDPDLKTYINSELDELKSNAATIVISDIERPGGGFDLHLCMKPVNLGMPSVK